MTAGSLSAIAFAPAAAQGAVVHVTGSPVGVAMSDAHLTSVNWDVDGTDGADFNFLRYDFGSLKVILLGSMVLPGTSQNGRGMVGGNPWTDNVLALQQSFSVGPTLAAGYEWGTGSVSGFLTRNAMNDFDTGNPGGPTYYIGYDFIPSFNIGDNVFGFRFLDGNDAMHYGWANINFDTTNGMVSITEWAYESTPDTAIHVPGAGDVVPLPGAHALGLLGLGAAGLMKWRHRRKEQATADA